MLIRDTKEVYRHKVEAAVGPNAKASDVLDFLFGDYDYTPSANFVIRKWRANDKTFLQRLNMFWAIPLTLLCAPLQYVFYGQVGWTTKHSFGRWVLRVTGHLREI